VEVRAGATWKNAQPNTISFSGIARRETFEPLFFVTICNGAPSGRRRSRRSHQEDRPPGNIGFLGEHLRRDIRLNPYCFLYSVDRILGI
jgi:hypothetical protein